MAGYADALKGITQEALAACTGRGGTPYDAAHLAIDEDGGVRVRVRTYYGGDGTPADEWHGRTLTYAVAPNADIDALRETLSEGGDAAALIDRIVAGHSVEWDGGNLVGRLDADARDASEALESLLEDLPRSPYAAWDADEWLLGQSTPRRLLADLGLGTAATDDEIAQAAKAAEKEAEMEMIVLVGEDVEDVLRRAIEKERERIAEQADLPLETRDLALARMVREAEACWLLDLGADGYLVTDDDDDVAAWRGQAFVDLRRAAGDLDETQAPAAAQGQGA